MQIAFRRSNAAGQGRGPFAETEAGVGLGSSADGHDLSNRPRVDAVAGTEHRCGSERCCRREGAAAAVQSPGCGVSKASQRRRAKTRAAGWCCTEDEVREHARPRPPTTGVILGTGAMGCVSRPRVPRTASWAPEEPKDGQGDHPEADTRRHAGREHLSMGGRLSDQSGCHGWHPRRITAAPRAVDAGRTEANGQSRRNALTYRT